MTTLLISLTPDAETKLKERAKAAGQEVSQFVEQLIVKELDAPLSLAEAAEPLAKEVDASGISDDEFTSLITESRDAVRLDRHRFVVLHSVDQK